MVAPGAVFCPTCGSGLGGPVVGAPMAPMGMAPMGMPGQMPGQGMPPMQQMPMGGGYGYNPYGAPGMMMPQTRTSGMAIAGFVLSLVFCGILGLIFSIMGKNEIQRSGGMVTGSGFATAGIVISIIRMVIEVLYIVFIVVAIGSNGHF
jgi:hypothetical protein